MKKILAFLFIAAILTCLCSCGSRSGSAENDTAASEISESESDIWTSEETQALTDESETQSEQEETSGIIETAKEIASTAKEVITETVKAVTSTTKPTTTTTKPSTTKPTTTTTKPSTTKPTTTTTRPSTTTTTRPSTTVVNRQRYGEKFTFETTDINGRPVSSSDYAGANLIMINMWEPWCGPCVRELSDLQQLYTNYKSKGFVLLGVFSDNIDDAKTLIREKGLTYPILMESSHFNRFYTGSVPTTVFLDGEGYPLDEEPYIGSRSYDAWEQIVKSHMG